MSKEPLYPHVPKSKQKTEDQLKKYKVTILFVWESPHHRELAWAEVKEYIRKHMRDLATVLSVSQELPPKEASETIAINEPYRR